MNKPGCHRTGLDTHFGVDTSLLRNTSRNWPGIGGADAAPEPLALLVDNADRGRLLRYVQPNIMRHRNLRWCKSPGKMPGSRHYRCLRLRPAITRGPQHLLPATPSDFPIDPEDLQSRSNGAMAGCRRRCLNRSPPAAPSCSRVSNVMEWMPPAAASIAPKSEYC